jgi:ribosomal protein S12 methylthiotransferase accessory factor
MPKKSISFSPRAAEELKHVVPAGEFFEQKALDGLSVYKREPLLIRVKIMVLTRLVQLLEWLAGVRVYAENNVRELYGIDARLRSFLLKLIEQKLIVSWKQLPCYPDAPPVIRYGVTVRLRVPGYDLPTMSGYGTGTTHSEALFLSVTEALERHASAVWDERKILRGTFNELGSRGACDPEILNFLPPQGADEVKDVRDAKLGWVKARGFLDEREYLVPAQHASFLYASRHLEEPLLTDGNSNAFAAGSEWEQAVYGAACEAIERDALMGFWLNRIAPPKIHTDSAPFPKVLEQVQALKRYGYEIHFFDMTTDLRIPTFATMLIDPTGEMPVSMSAATGFDIEHSFHKLMLETVKYAHYRVPHSAAPQVIRNISDRRRYWAQKDKQGDVQFFLKGKEQTLNMDVHSPGNTKACLAELKKILRSKGYSGYVIDVTTPEAARAGLVIVKVLIPELIPVFFDEAHKPLGMKRLSEFPALNGYPRPERINPIPHPFV